MTYTHVVTGKAVHPKITDDTAQSIRRLYLYHRKEVEENRGGQYDFNRKRMDRSMGEANGILETLNFLGIEISKVNAP